MSSLQHYSFVAPLTLGSEPLPALRSVAVERFAAPVGFYPAIKRAGDVLISLLAAVIVVPVIVLCAIVVCFTSPGGAFYSQTRLGRDGRPFRIWKLRSMRQDCERHTGAQWSSKVDPRVTAIGWYLRRFHLDELPQLWNIFKGDMSLIGPRPERPEFVDSLEIAIPGYHDRLVVRPGLTGLGQIQLPPDTGLESVRRKLVLDRIYIQNLGWSLDLRLLVGTALYLVGMSYESLRSLLRLPAPANFGPEATTMPDQPSVSAHDLKPTDGSGRR